MSVSMLHSLLQCASHTHTHSSHVPSYLISAFVKRLARIALTASPDVCVYVCGLSWNLLLKHPTCQVLLHRLPKLTASYSSSSSSSSSLSSSSSGGLLLTSKQSNEMGKGEAFTYTHAYMYVCVCMFLYCVSYCGSLDFTRRYVLHILSFIIPLPILFHPIHTTLHYTHADPFKMDELDPSKANAHSSSLWELKTLTNHYSPSVAKLARSFFDPKASLQPLEAPEFAHESYPSLFEKERQYKKNQRMPQQHEKVTSFQVNARFSLQSTVEVEQ
jgi:hypothetical protein